jgi:hypothetical protein
MLLQHGEHDCLASAVSVHDCKSLQKLWMLSWWWVLARQDTQDVIIAEQVQPAGRFIIVKQMARDARLKQTSDLLLALQLDHAATILG